MKTLITIALLLTASTAIAYREQPREPVEYNTVHVYKKKPRPIANKPLSEKTLKSMQAFSVKATPVKQPD